MSQTEHQYEQDKPLLAWHWLPDNGKLRWPLPSEVGSRTPKVGETLEVDPNSLELCCYGLHACEDLWDAMHWAPGGVLCRVEVSGKVIKDNGEGWSGVAKLVAQRRKVLWKVSAKKVREVLKSILLKHARRVFTAKKYPKNVKFRRWLRKGAPRCRMPERYDVLGNYISISVESALLEGYPGRARDTCDIHLGEQCKREVLKALEGLAPKPKRAKRTKKRAKKSAR